MRENAFDQTSNVMGYLSPIPVDNSVHKAVVFLERCQKRVPCVRSALLDHYSPSGEL
jgi:hypothetical protein